MIQSKIRSATRSDLPILLEFEQGIITAERPFDSTLKPGHINYYDLGELIKSAHAEVLVAEIDNEVVASGYSNILNGKEYHSHNRFAYLGFMFVKPEHRGKGLIQQILNSLVDWSRSQGIQEIRLEVYNDNEPAMKAYEKTGFKRHMVEMRLDIKEGVT